MFKRLKDKILRNSKIRALNFFNLEMIEIKNIKIPKEFKKHYPSKNKMKERWNYYNRYKEVKVPIIIDRDNVLIDGYTSYLIAKKIGADEVSVKRV